jgi:putative peptidoglycan lipid II flippase
VATAAAQRSDAPLWTGVATSALLIAGLTAASRLTGLIRTVVFAATVGPTDLGDLYQSANTVPNVAYEIVAGGALAVAVVPVLARPIALADTRRVSELASALLTWTLVLLTPLAAIVALAAPAVVTLLVGGRAEPATLATGALLVRVFAVQIPLYGVGVVLTGVLNAHRRYAWPAVAPLLSSLVMIVTCAAFTAVAGRAPQLAQVGRGPVLLLAIGTTAAVAALTLSLALPVRTLGLRLSPRLRLEPAVRGQIVGLAGASIVLVVAQELATLWLIRLANGGPDGSVVLLALAQKVVLAPTALLALPLAIAVYPRLARANVLGDGPGFDAALARATRCVVRGAGLGVAALVAGAPLLARGLVPLTAARLPAGEVAAAVAAFAPGLFGLGLLAILTRGLTAAGAAGRAAAWVAAGWAVAVLVAGLAVRLDPAGPRVALLGVASSIGLSVLGVGLLFTVRGRRGVAALAGCGRTVLIGVAGAALAGGCGWLVGGAVPVLGPVLGLVVFALVMVPDLVMAVKSQRRGWAW